MRHNEAVEKLDLSFFRDRNSLFLIKLNFLKFVFMGFFYSLNVPGNRRAPGDLCKAQRPRARPSWPGG